MSIQFFGGLVVGATLMAAAFTIFFNKKVSRRPRREIPEWEAEFFEEPPPIAVTRIQTPNRRREIVL